MVGYPSATAPQEALEKPEVKPQNFYSKVILQITQWGEIEAMLSIPCVMV